MRKEVDFKTETSAQLLKPLGCESVYIAVIDLEAPRPHTIDFPSHVGCAYQRKADMFGIRSPIVVKLLCLTSVRVRLFMEMLCS